jgi:hypothetical protein
MELPCFKWFSEFMTGFIYETGVDITDEDLLIMGI